MGVVLDVAIGIVFLYALLGLMATTAQELLAAILRLRARNLYDALGEMLTGDVAVTMPAGVANKRLVHAFYEHPLIKNLCQTPPRFEGGELLNPVVLPSYIPSKTFAVALLDVLRGDATASGAIGVRDILAQADTTIDAIANEDLKRALKILVGEAKAGAKDLDEAAARVSERIEGWFNDRMARARGWYKRQSQWIALVIAGTLTVAVNADSIYVVDRLWKDEALRASVAAAAQAYQSGRGQAVPVTADPTTPDPSAPAGSSAQPASGAPVGSLGEQLTKDYHTLTATQLPIGWSSFDEKRDWLSMLLGWLLTTLAVSLGATFWFDLLSKALNLRGSGTRVSATSGRNENGER